MPDHSSIETRRETLDCFDESGTPMTTMEVAECLDIGRRSAYDRLARLADGGYLETKKAGAGGRVWWRPERGSNREGHPAIWTSAGDALFYDILNYAEVGIFVLDSEFEVVRINEATERYFGIDAEQVHGADKRTVITETIASKLEDEDCFAERVLATYDDNTYTERFECHITPAADREERWLEHRSKPIDSGALAGGRIELYYDITGRKRSELTQKRHNEHLAALNELNGIAHDITDTTISGSTRAEIERTVCDRLADSNSYQFAWIGDVDSRSDMVQIRTRAGIGESLDERQSSVNRDGSTDPVRRAVRTGEITTTQDVEGDCCSGRATEFGCRSSVAIPIVHEGTSYGILAVYAKRAHAFAGPKQDVMEHLGEIVGHGIAATERKRALMSDEVTELEFVIPDIFGGTEGTAGTITLETAIPIDDDQFLVYGTATADAVDSVTTLVANDPHWKGVSFDETDGDTTFELRLSEPPVFSTIAAAGGSVENATIEDGDYRLTIHVHPSVPITRISDPLESLYPTVRMCKRRQISRDDRLPHTIRSALADDLTDSQRQSLETAYHGGFFDWPRGATGQEIADSLGIAPSTFHYHLRVANRKVLEKLLSDGTTTHS